MTAATFIALDRVWEMLNGCLPGWSKRTTAHHHRIFCPGHELYPSLPLGEHGNKQHAEIKAGNIRNMVRHFGIEACAKKALPEAFG